MKPKPKTQAEFAAWRCRKSCKMGIEAMDKKSQTSSCSALEFAVFNLLHAVDDLSIQIEEGRKI